MCKVYAIITDRTDRTDRTNVLFKLVLKDLCVYQTVDEEELQDVQQHPPKRDLQWPQMRVGCEE